MGGEVISFMINLHSSKYVLYYLFKFLNTIYESVCMHFCYNKKRTSDNIVIDCDYFYMSIFDYSQCNQHEKPMFPINNEITYLIQRKRRFNL